MILVAVMSVILACLKVAYGQSIVELQKAVGNATLYRTELEAYINLHNITFSTANGNNHLNISSLDIFDLETSVESHMQFCKSDHNMDERIRSQEIRGTDWAIRVNKKIAFGDC
jgi:hypothetical protein